MRRSLENLETEDIAPLLNAPLQNAPPADTVKARELQSPEMQARQNALIATRNPNALVGTRTVQETLAATGQMSDVAREREKVRRRNKALETAVNGDGGPYQRFADIFETFAVALASGMTIGTALRQAIRNAPDEYQTLFAAVAQSVEQGATLTQALKQHEEQLPDLVVPIFEHGTIYGTEENAARQLARALKRLAQVEEKFLYSALNTGVWMPLVAGGVLILSLLPLFLMFANPLIPFLLLSAVCLGVGALGWKYRHRLSQRKSRHPALARMALWGLGTGFVRRQIGGARWSRTFAALWNCGVPISSALEAAGRSANNAYYERILREAAQSTRNGLSLGESLAHVGLLKGEMLDTIRAGELTGELGPALEQWANVLEDDGKERGGMVLFAWTFGLLFVFVVAVCLVCLSIVFGTAGG